MVDRQQLRAEIDAVRSSRPHASGDEEDEEEKEGLQQPPHRHNHFSHSASTSAVTRVSSLPMSSAAAAATVSSGRLDGNGAEGGTGAPQQARGMGTGSGRYARAVSPPLGDDDGIGEPSRDSDGRGEGSTSGGRGGTGGGGGGTGAWAADGSYIRPLSPNRPHSPGPYRRTGSSLISPHHGRAARPPSASRPVASGLDRYADDLRECG